MRGSKLGVGGLLAAIIVFAQPTIARPAHQHAGKAHDNTNKLTQVVNHLSYVFPLHLLPQPERQQLLCTALTIYQEARGQSETEQALVAKVVDNRTITRQLKPCAVVAQPGQFPWVRKLPKRFQPKEKFAWLKAQTVAMLDKLQVYPQSSCQFEYFSVGLHPAHRRNLTCGIKYAGHYYYKLREPRG